ncbi:MOSC domain-containing protein YiiM [Flavimobilis soli]|uniref:MOSC domain-containing protein YiiM n=1 Tax=Flavimobilis soli TaxID=442709 RepID=A0A2A9E985_9MICO|nr:MOSC domain-containing protein [Flavimobilis soli]PFG35383.1 MOSC domain-containing protein YiiM [Flavimobilis soli]
MTTATLVAVCRAPRTVYLPALGKETAIDKLPTTEAVAVGPLGLEGDTQADRKHHGGPDKALYAYAQHEAEEWARRLGRPVPPGLFGENLRVAGMETSAATIGQTWRIGEEVVVEATMPRTPCTKFAERMGEPRWVRRFAEAGLLGAYLRVVQPGTVRSGDPIETLSRPDHGVTVASWFANQTPDAARALLDAHESGAVRLADEMVERAAKVLAR